MREKISKHPPAPTASTVGSCPTIIKISRTPRHWKFTLHHRTTRQPLRMYVCMFTSNKITFQDRRIKVKVAKTILGKLCRHSRVFVYRPILSFFHTIFCKTISWTSSSLRVLGPRSMSEWLFLETKYCLAP